MGLSYKYKPYKLKTTKIVFGERHRRCLLRSRHNIPPISRRENDGYKVPSKYTTNFLQVFYEFIRTLDSRF
jgi:hypothetical protein